MVTCNKCHQYTPLGNHSWCLGCTGVEALQGELAAPWRTSGFRAAANDLVVSAVRGVKALTDLSQSVYSAEQSRAATRQVSSKASSAPPSPEAIRPKLPAPPPPPPRRDVLSPDSQESEEEEEDEQVTGAAAKSGASRRPPEPDYPPPGHREADRREHHADRGRSKTLRRERRRGKEGTEAGQEAIDEEQNTPE